MQKYLFKKVYIFFFSVLICMLHLPFAFSTSKPLSLIPEVAEVANAESMETTEHMLLYSNLNLSVQGLSEEAFLSAMKGFGKLSREGQLENDNVITIIDFTKPSTVKRMFVLDVEEEKLLYKTYVAHGQRSGREFATQFSNIPESFQSSLGFYETSTTYNGKNGYSLKLKGLEYGINNKAEERAVVMHGAPYVSESFINAHGYLGRSFGCPALPEKLNRPIIDKIKNGTCLFIYKDNKSYLHKSRILNS